MAEPETVPCELCGTPTAMTGTKRCDRCWELEHRIEEDPALAWQIIYRITYNNPGATVPMILANAWIIPHRGDPCVLCRKPIAEVEPGGCPVDVIGLYSRIGDLQDQAAGLDEGNFVVESRAALEEVKRLRLLHLVLSRDLVPVVPHG